MNFREIHYYLSFKICKTCKTFILHFVTKTKIHENIGTLLDIISGLFINLCSFERVLEIRQLFIIIKL